MAIIGSEQWQLTHTLRRDEIREEIKSWLRFSLIVKPDMQLIVRQDAKNFDVADVVLSRCEVSLAFQCLGKKTRWALWDVVVKGRPAYKVAIQRGLDGDSIRRLVDMGLARMEKRIYERIETSFQGEISENLTQHA